MTRRTTKSHWDLVRENGMKTNAAAQKRKEQTRIALIALGVDRQKLEREAHLSEILSERSLGGLPVVLDAMRLSADPVIVRFIERYDQMNKSFKAIVPWEAVAQLAGLNVRELLGAIIVALRERSTIEVKIAALTSYPAVTQATVQSAMILGPDGVRDRQMVHQALGFLPTPKGQTINLNLAGAVEPADANREVPAEDIDMEDLFPDLTTTQKLLEE